MRARPRTWWLAYTLPQAVALACALSLPGLRAEAVNADPDGVAGTGASLDYARDVAPILRAYCAGCHDDRGREAKFSVETYAELRKGGEDHGDPVRPGDPDASFLIRSIEGRERPVMPPKDEPRVPAEELETLRRWVASGAPGPAKDISILRELAVPRLKPAAGPAGYSAAAYSTDGRHLALGRSGVIELWNTLHQTLVREITGLPGKVNALGFSPDGSRLVAATGVAGLAGVARVFNVADGACTLELGEHTDILYDAEFSPDGEWLATAGYDRVIRLWRVSDGSLVRSIDVHKGAVFDLAWHPSGKVLASASADETVKLWRVSDGMRLDTLNQPQGEMLAVRFTPDGQHILAAGGDKRIHAWRFVTRDAPGLNPVVHSRFAHESGVHAIAITPDGRHLLSSANDRTLKLWSLPDLRLLHVYPPQPEIPAAVVAIPDSGRFLIARMDGRTEAVSVEKGDPGEDGEEPGGNGHGTAAAVARGSAPAGEPVAVNESEPNDDAARAMPISWPATVAGSIGRSGDADLFRFGALSGIPIALEIDAARSGSKLDSRIEVLHPDGRPVEQVVLQATRDSWFTFRGKDSESPDDFRLHNWAEMELDEYLYANGEVVRLWLYPRGPDSGFKVYPGEGRRWTYFGTTALAHALGEPAYVVAPWPAGSTPTPNGLPVFRLNYVNDDDPGRRRGTDSFLIFRPPADGDYLVRVTDVRGFGGAEGYSYTLAVRPPRPGFRVSLASGSGAKVSPGGAREVLFKAERQEGFDGPIRIDIESLPKGFTASTPIEIESGQITAAGVLMAAEDAASPGEAEDRLVRVVASATVDGAEVRQEVGTLGDLQVGPPAKVTVEILPGADRSGVVAVEGRPLEFQLRAGQTLQARVRAVRRDFKGQIELGNEDSGRNLPHGVYVDNIGLNGLLIVEGESERDFFVTASKIARPGRRMFHLRARADDGQASRPVVLNVLPAEGPAVAVLP